MNPGEVVGAIKVERRPRQKKSPKQKADALDKQIAKLEQRLLIKKQQRASLVAELKAALAEIEG